MTPQEYIEKFNIPVTTFKFDYSGFLNEFGQEFNQKANEIDNYADFQNLLRETAQKFAETLGLEFNKKGKLKQPLWKAFFAIYVVPLRKEKFPEVQDKIDFYREKTRNNGKENN
jgi:hypothetical protein